MRFVVVCLAVFACLTASSQAQDSLFENGAPPQANRPASASMQPETMTSPFQRRADDPQSPTELRDPTSPSARLLEHLPIPTPVETPVQPPATPTSPTRARQTATSIPLPELPQITLRGMVMRTPDRGTAMLDVDGTSVTISLLPRQEQHRVSIPAMQFAELRAALRQRAALTRQANSSPMKEESDPTYEMCLQCSFISNGIVFNLEAFTPDALLLRAVPHDSVLIIRKQSGQR